MKLKWFFVLIAALLGVKGVDAQVARETITVDGVERTYILHVPASYDASTPVPLVLGLHGGGGNAAQFSRRNQLTTLSDEHDFIVVYPDGLDHGWNDSRELDNRTSHDDVGFISALIDYLSSLYNLDPTRVFSTGVSNGGIMSYRLACELSDKIRAIAPVVGLMPAPLVESCAPAQPVAVRIVAGTKDPLVPYDGGGVGFFGGRGQVLSAPATAALWAGYNGCSTEASLTKLTDVIEVTTYAGCNAPVELYTVIGGTHDWYGRVARSHDPIDAATTVWEFFSSF